MLLLLLLLFVDDDDSDDDDVFDGVWCALCLDVVEAAEAPVVAVVYECTLTSLKCALISLVISVDTSPKRLSSRLPVVNSTMAFRHEYSAVSTCSAFNFSTCS